MLRLFTGLLFSFLLLRGGAAEGQGMCPEGKIARIVVESGSIFTDDDIPEDGRLVWAYHLANWVHVQTREGFILGALLFEEGDCFDPAVLAESARLLREYHFIAAAEAEGVARADGAWDVVVRTRDEWTTKVSLDVHFKDGFRMEGLSLFEENLLGRGVTVGVFGVDREERREAGVALKAPSVFGSSFDLRSDVQRTRIGSGAELTVVRPFRGELPGGALRQVAAYRRDFFSYVLPEHPRYSHVVLPVVEQRMELSAARRFNLPGNLSLLGGGVSFERRGVGRSDEVEGIRARDFSDREPVTPDMAAAVGSQLHSRRAVRLNLLLGLRKLEFETRQGLDAIAGVQDIAVGHEGRLSLGRSVAGTTSGQPGDMFSRINLFAGRSGSRTVSQLHLAGEGRRKDADTSASPEWSDLLLEAHGFFYWTYSGFVPQTWVLRGAMHAGWRTTSPFQLNLGGPDGVRGYGETDFPGGRRAVLSVENRVPLPSPFPDLADLGVTLFADIGAAWSGDAPFGIDSGLRGTAGGGIRLGFPAGSSSVIRADLAFPVGPGASSRGPVLRISAQEWIGIIGDFRSPQIERSRGTGIRGEYRGVAREAPIP